MDLESRKKLSDLIKTATSTGTLELSTEHVQQFKLILKKSNSNVKSAFDLLFDRLKIKHSQVRISAVNIINEIFMRSKYFRELLCGVLSVFFEYTLGLNRNTLPPPINSALHLKAKTLEYIEKWNESFGAHYSLLKNGYYYLKNSLNLNFPEIRAQSQARSREEIERKERTQTLLRLKYDKFKVEFLDISNSIQSLINEMEETFKEMIPDPSDNFGDLFGSDDEDYKDNLKKQKQFEDEEEEEGRGGDKEINHSNIVREGGFGSLNYAIEVSVNPEDTKTNLDPKKVKKLSEMVTELEKYQNLTVNDWYTTLIKIDINPQADPEYSTFLRKVILIQQEINSIKSKSKDIDILPFKNIDDEHTTQQGIDGNGEDEFEGIEMEEYIAEQDDDENKTTTTTTTTTTTSTADKNIYKPYYKRDIKPIHVDELPEEESIEDLLKRAPVVPLDPTLLFWGQKEIVLDTGINREHRFLGGGNESTISIENYNLLNQVTYTMEDEIQAPSIPCNFPLKGGNLCQRRDLKICPFHGKIVPRDDITGELLNKDDYHGEKITTATITDDEEDNNNEQQENEQDENGNNITPKKRRVVHMIGTPLYKHPVKEKEETPKKQRPNPNLIDISEKANETVKSKIDKILTKKK